MLAHPLICCLGILHAHGLFCHPPIIGIVNVWLCLMLQSPSYAKISIRVAAMYYNGEVEQK